MRAFSTQGKAAAYDPVVKALAVAGMSVDAKIGPTSDSALGPFWLSAIRRCSEYSILLRQSPTRRVALALQPSSGCSTFSVPRDGSS